MADTFRTTFEKNGTFTVDFKTNKVWFKDEKGRDMGQTTIFELYTAINSFIRTAEAHAYFAEKGK